MELTLLMEPITAMHHCLMAQKGQQVMLEDVEVRILNNLDAVTSSGILN